MTRPDDFFRGLVFGLAFSLPFWIGGAWAVMTTVMGGVR